MRKISFKVLTLSCILFLIFIGYKNEKKQVEKNLEQMMSQPVSLGLEKMQCRRAPIKDNGSHYKMVVYIDFYRMHSMFSQQATLLESFDKKG